ncbi:MAG: hypothetical protein GY797_16005 [Deltaproteobacteria bacterium]|nr:hypothetical protein [Deltaproteobacteria bacterium]MCP5007176.1 hypothetical protein [Planctomycetota bacterium]
MLKNNLIRASILGDGVYSNLLITKIRIARTRNLQKMVLDKYSGFLGILLGLSKRDYVRNRGLSFVFALQFIPPEKRDVIRIFKNTVHGDVERPVKKVLANERAVSTELKQYSINNSFLTFLSSIHDRTETNLLKKTGIFAKNENLTIFKTDAPATQMGGRLYNAISYKTAPELKFLTTVRQTLAGPVKIPQSYSTEKFHHETIKELGKPGLPVGVQTQDVPKNYVSHAVHNSHRHETLVSRQDTEFIINQLKQPKAASVSQNFPVLPGPIKNFFVMHGIKKKINHLTKVRNLINKFEERVPGKVLHDVLKMSYADTETDTFNREGKQGMAKTLNPIYKAHAFKQEFRNTFESTTTTALYVDSVTEHNKVQKTNRSIDLVHKVNEINTKQENMGNTMYTAPNAGNGDLHASVSGAPFGTVPEAVQLPIPVGIADCPERKDGIRQEDVDTIAEKVYSVIEDKIRTENERRGIFY